MPGRIIGEHATAFLMNVHILSLTLTAASFSLTAVGLAIDWQYVALVVGSTFAGSLLLGFFRPEKTFPERVKKIGMAQVAGLIFGSAIVAWRTMETPAYISVTYCMASMVALILLRSLVGITETNAGRITTTLIQRAFNIPVAEEKPEHEVHRKPRNGRRKRSKMDGVGVHISHNPGDKQPTVTIDENARPDEIRVIEQTVVEQKKDG